MYRSVVFHDHRRGCKGEIAIKRLDDFVLKIGRQEFVPLIVGGMGVDVSTPELALPIARLGGIAHLSDAMIEAVVDRHCQTDYVKSKRERFKRSIGLEDKSAIQFDSEQLRSAIDRYVRPVMEAKRGCGAILMNVMEKLTMANSKATLKTRLTAPLDAGIDGLTLGAGLHLGSLDLMADHPRFREALIGVIVSSSRALKLFLKRAAKLSRMPDYVVVEGPLAGGHLGFPMNWREFDLKEIVGDVLRLLEENSLKIPVIAAGGVFTGSDAVRFVEMGASGVQVATRFAVTKESGLPDHVKQAFFRAEPEDVIVNTLSPTGYPMRMLRQSPAVQSFVAPMCEAFGYGLGNDGVCQYTDWYYHQSGEDGRTPEKRICLCATMHGYKVWTCGHTVSRLKETTNLLQDGTYQLPSAAHVFTDYQTSVDDQILPLPLEETETKEPISTCV